MADVTLQCEDCDFTVTAPEKGAGSANFKMGTHRWRQHGIRSNKEPKHAKAPVAPVVELELVEGGAGEAYAEQKPTEPKHAKKEEGGIFTKFWAKGDDKPSLMAPKTAERKPVTPKRRVSTADFWGDLVGPVAGMSAKAGYVPMARAMEWSSPVVGEIIEDATKGTPLDRIAQPFVRNSEKWQDLFDLLGFWAAIGMAQRNPANAAGSLDFARKRLVNLLPRIAANIKKERAKERQAVDALIELMPDIAELFPDAGPGDDPVTLLIQSLFAAPEQVYEQPVAV